MLVLDPKACPLLARNIRKPNSPRPLLSKHFLGEQGDLSDSATEPPGMSLFDVWNTSRTIRSDGKDERNEGPFLQPGSRRKCSLANISLAFTILQATFFDMFLLLWGLNPIRTTILVFLTIVRGLLPAFRGYSQALILDEVTIHLLFV